MGGGAGPLRRGLPWLVGLLGGGLLVAGVLVFAAANREPVGDFGWTSHAPLQPVEAHQSRLTLTFSDGWTVLWTGGHLLGAGLAVAGLLVLAALAGWALGRRGGGVSRGRPPGGRPPS